MSQSSRRRRQVYSQAIGRAQQALSKGINVVIEILENVNAPASARVAAFGKLEDMARRGMEIEDLEVRITDIEEKLKS